LVEGAELSKETNPTTKGLMHVYALEGRRDIARLIEELTNPTEDELTVRGAAVAALGRLRALEALEDLAVRLHEDHSPTVRALAAKAISRLESDKVTEHLTQALDDPEPRVRWQAAFNLGRNGDRRAAEPLIGLLGSDDFVLRRAAAAALGRIGGPSARDALITARDEDTFWKRRIYNKAIRSIDKRRRY
jgi:HEAT repeat protein